MGANDDLNSLFDSVQRFPGLNVVFFVATLAGGYEIINRAGEWVKKSVEQDARNRKCEYRLEGVCTVHPAGVPRAVRHHYFDADSEATAQKVLQNFEATERGWTWSLYRQ